MHCNECLLCTDVSFYQYSVAQDDQSCLFMLTLWLNYVPTNQTRSHVCICIVLLSHKSCEVLYLMITLNMLKSAWVSFVGQRAVNQRGSEGFPTAKGHRQPVHSPCSRGNFIRMREAQ